VCSGDFFATAWLAQLSVPLLLDVEVSGVNVSLVLGELSLSLLNVYDNFDSGVLGSVLDLDGSLLSGDLDLVLSLLGKLGDLLLAHLELSSDSVQLLLVEVSSNLDLPKVNSGLVTLSPVLESESGDSGSAFDVLASAFSSLLDSDHFLSLRAPLLFLLNSDNLGFLALDLLVDFSLVDFHVGFNLDSLGDVLPLEALVGLVEFSILDALIAASFGSVDAVFLAVVSFEGSADGSVSTLVGGFDSLGSGLFWLRVLIRFLFFINNLVGGGASGRLSWS